MDAARSLAKRMSAAKDDKDGLVLGFRSCLARSPSDAETARLLSLLNALRASYSSNPDAAKKIAGDTTSAAWTMVASTILNLDETITKE
jgi:hypothetical protein